MLTFPSSPAPAGAQQLQLTDINWEFTCESLEQKQALLAYAKKVGVGFSHNQVRGDDLGLGWNEYSSKLYAYPAESNGKDASFITLTTERLLALFDAYAARPR